MKLEKFITESFNRSVKSNSKNIDKQGVYINENIFSRKLMDAAKLELRRNIFEEDSNEVFSSEDENSKEGEISLDENNDITKNFITGIQKSIGNANIYFEPIIYNKDSGEVRWGGTLAGLEWSVVRNKSEQGFYVKSQSPILLTKDNTKQLNILNNYIDTTWFPQIGEAVQNGTLETGEE